MCQGPEIAIFPDFGQDIRLSTVHIDLENTRLKKLPDLRSWPHLSVLDVRNNPILPCHELVDLQKERFNLDIHSDCYLGGDRTVPINPLLLSLEVQVGLMWVVGFIYGIWKAIQRKRRQPCPSEDFMTTPC